MRRAPIRSMPALPVLAGLLFDCDLPRCPTAGFFLPMPPLSGRSDQPETLRSISEDEIALLEVDRRGRLYWDGKPVEVSRLTFWQTVGALESIYARARRRPCVTTIVFGRRCRGLRCRDEPRAARWERDRIDVFHPGTLREAAPRFTRFLRAPREKSPVRISEFESSHPSHGVRSPRTEYDPRTWFTVPLPSSSKHAATGIICTRTAH
jgi:hypothetical protein